MLPEYIPNFLATLAHPPWTEPLRHHLYMTLSGEQRTPFALYVQPSATSTNSICQNSLFILFNALPAELQLRILTFCSASTLFQLMRVSSSLRVEARKLFWAHPDAYFVVEAHWFFDGGYAGYTYNDLAFLAQVQNIQIDYEPGSHEVCPLHDDGIEEVRQDRIEHFWQTVQKRCPRAKRIIINHDWVPISTRKETHCVPRALQHLVRLSPSEITTCTFVVEHANNFAGSIASDPSSEKCQRAVYQLCPDGSWEKTKSGQDWKTVLVPAKQFSGPVGQFHELQHRGSLFFLEEDGLWPILVEALDRYHFDGGRNQPFSCPSARCDGYFQKPGEWTIHAAEFHNQEWMGSNSIDMLPEEVQGDLEEGRARVAKKREEMTQRGERIREEWNSAGQEQQREIRRLWLEQLRDDPLWETGEGSWIDNRLWQEF